MEKTTHRLYMVAAEEEPDYKTLVNRKQTLQYFHPIFFQKKRISQIFRKNRMYLKTQIKKRRPRKNLLKNQTISPRKNLLRNQMKRLRRNQKIKKN